MRRWGGASGAAALLVLATAPGASAADSSIDYVEATKDGLQILVSVPPDATVDTENVAVSVEGTTAPATAAPADTTTSVKRTAVLVMDTSNSMRGERLASAQAAASTFLDSVPDDVLVGIVTFDREVIPVLEPTTDRDEARAEIQALELNKETRLYDGIQAGLDLVGSDGQRQLLVLSDGADTSTTALEDVTSDISTSDVLVSVVALDQERPQALEALEALAGAGDGSVVSSDSDELTETFTAQADVLARQILVTAEVPASVTAREGTVEVTLGSDQGDLTTAVFAPFGTSAAPAESTPVAGPSTTASVNSYWMYGGLAAVALGLVGIAVGLLGPRRSSALAGADLATTYTRRVSGIGAAEEGAGVEQAMASATERAEKVLKSSKGLEARISERLEGAGNPFRPAEWLIIHAGFFVLSGIVAALLSSILFGVLILFAGAVGPWLYLGFKRTRRRKAFEHALPDTLQLISGSLAAGLSLAQSIDTVVKEGQEPISSEFQRVLVETRLGISLDDALEGVADRFESKDFAWIVMAIRIQRQVGGNLAELLDTVAGTIREREYMRRQVAALAAEGKLSAWVLGGLPPAFMLYLLAAKRDYVMPMFTEPMGWVMLGGAGTLLAVGVFWMSRLVKVEV